jgi:redox-sensitive bicupin YhaK (pirin superfamily)
MSALKFSTRASLENDALPMMQWMTAASGVVHEEMHEREFAKNGGTFEMVQLWVNLPKAYKMSPPRYQTLLREQIPVVQLGEGATARVIAGELNGAKGPAKTFTPVNVFDVRLKAGSFAEIALADGHRAGLVLLRGAIQVNTTETVQGEARLVVLSADGGAVRLYARQDSIVLVLSGEPIDEPVASYGPFVMNSREEIVQAVRDYNAGKMGHLH